jgi:hypothetical protein
MEVQALGLQSSSRAPLELRHSALREQHLLLVLDTFEQVIAAAPLPCARLALNAFTDLRICS